MAARNSFILPPKLAWRPAKAPHRPAGRATRRREAPRIRIAERTTIGAMAARKRGASHTV
eukprot:CAMPEP_0183347972 /NCGR_PEP_ID=MMETSP0164_2-20130417/12633_1 /TAXON_ID=221442 /ORGANISM="Coccolithus pelagicus ssp braarudi, Strain PLY182g" /LENGTH=59 /DNA_ID=CAMNT_0025519495 /DNA_START=1047 /DNA_END=1222 /DNA_ORIENTATION=-